MSTTRPPGPSANASPSTTSLHGVLPPHVSELMSIEFSHATRGRRTPDQVPRRPDHLRQNGDGCGEHPRADPSHRLSGRPESSVYPRCLFYPRLTAMGTDATISRHRPTVGSSKSFEEVAHRHARSGNAGDRQPMGNYMSDQHLWFQAASPTRSPYRDRVRRAGRRTGPTDPELRSSRRAGRSRSTTSRQYYSHRFYEHQPDLTSHLRDEIVYRIVGFRCAGVSGFRWTPCRSSTEARGHRHGSLDRPPPVPGRPRGPS